MKSGHVKLSSSALALSQFIQKGEMLGVALCKFDLSGCYDIGRAMSSQLNVPYIRVKYNAGNPAQCTIHGDLPPQSGTKYKAVFFTGCQADPESMVTLVNLLSGKYLFTEPDVTELHVFGITPPHHVFPKGENFYAVARDQKRLLQHYGLLKSKPKLDYDLLASEVDTSRFYNIGIPRFEAKESQFEVAPECYGVMRRFLLFLDKEGQCPPNIEIYLHEYFLQVSEAGKDSTKKPIMVIALEIGQENKAKLIEIANEYSITINFCDEFNGRLPQGDFFKLLSVMGHRKGIVSLENHATQSLLQAISFNAFTMVFTTDHFCIGFQVQLIELIPKEDRDVAGVILGMANHYELLKDKTRCQRVYDIWREELNKAHVKFDELRSSSRQPHRLMSLS